MKTKDTQFSVFNYTDYRFLLRDYYAAQKRAIRTFSYRFFSVRAGVAASVLKDVIEGRRRLSLDVMQKYAIAMKLNEKETAYFGLVVQFVNSKTNDEKNAVFNKMIRLRGNLMMKFMEAKHYEFFKHWYYSAIRELVTLPGFSEDYEWIGKRCMPPITAAQARKAVETMLQIGLVKRNAAGKLELADAIISSEYEMESFLLRNFHSEMILLAKEALERFEPEQREISSLTLGVSQKCYDRLKERIRTFKQEILNMVVEDTTDSETVCQCNFQLFPLTDAKANRKGSAR